MPEVYRCPSHRESKIGETRYAMLVGPHAISNGPGSRCLADITDSLSDTIFVVEMLGVTWLEPRDLETATMTYQVRQLDDNRQPLATDPWSDHPGLVQALFGDGKVRGLPQGLKPERLKPLTTIGGGERVPTLEF